MLLIDKTRENFRLFDIRGCIIDAAPPIKAYYPSQAARTQMERQ